MEDLTKDKGAGRLRGIFLKYRVELCVLVAFVSWMLVLVNQARRLNASIVDGLVFMMVDTNIMNLMLFLFPLSYILLVFGMGRRYDSIKTVPNKYEAAFGIAVCILSFFMRYITTIVKPGTGDYGITDYMVFLVGISYLFFGYEKFRGISRLLSGIFGSGETEKAADKEAGDRDAGHRGEKKKSRLALTWELIPRIDIVFWFILVMEIVYVVYQSKFFESELMRRLQPFEASLTSNILRLFGYPVTSGGITGDMVTVVGLHGASSFWIDWGCTGILSITIYSLLGSALILTVPAKPWKKGVCIVGGIIVLFFSNILRLITIFLLAYYYDSKTALDFHTYSGYVFFLIFAGIFWFISLNYFLVEPKKKQDSKADKEIGGKMAGARKFTLDVGWVFGTVLVSMVVTFVLKIMIQRHYGPTGLANLGVYTILLTVYTLAYTIGEMGVSATVTKFVAEFRDNQKIRRRYASTAFISAIIYGIILCVVVFALSAPIAAFYKNPQLEKMLKIAAFIFPFLTVNNAIIGMFNGLRQMDKYGTCGIFRRVIVILYTGIFLAAGYSIDGAIIALVLAEASNFLLTIYFGRRLFFPLDLSRFKVITKRFWEYSPAVVMLNIIGQMEYRMDVLILGYFVGIGALGNDGWGMIGVYGIASNLAWVLPMIPRAMQTITFPMIARYNAKKMKESMERLVNTCLKYSLILLVLFGFILIFLGKIVLTTFFSDSRVLLAYTPMVILVCGLIFYGTMTSIGSAFLGIGKPSLSLRISFFVTWPIIIIGDLIMIPGVWVKPPIGIEWGPIASSVNFIIPSLGITGAAIASGVSFGVASIAYLALFVRHARIRILWKKQILIAIIAVISGLVIFACQLFMNVLLAFAIGAVIFAALLFLTNVIDSEERVLLKALIKSFL